MGETFTCHQCRQDKPVKTDGGTGYAIDGAGNKFCYACCALQDKAHMIEHGAITLYLSMPSSRLVCNWPRMVAAGTVENWPGTLKFTTGPIRVGRHNIAGVRYDCWFRGPDGEEWHGVTYGDNTQICHCRRVRKSTARRAA